METLFYALQQPKVLIQQVKPSPAGFRQLKWQNRVIGGFLSPLLLAKGMAMRRVTYLWPSHM